MADDVVAEPSGSKPASGKPLATSDKSAARSMNDTSPAKPTQGKLDLRIPDVTELYTPQQIQAILSSTSGDEYEEVEVRGTRIPATPEVWSGLGAPVWGLLNPTQVWRIIAPIPPDRIHAADVRPEAQPTERDPFRP
jgi:hypothetical protein